MSFNAVGVYDLDGLFIGYSIKEDGSQKLHTANLWTESDEDIKDLQAQLLRLNEAVDIRAYWPDVRDPEVVELLNDVNFQPLKMSPVEVEDLENSKLVWIEEPTEGSPGRLDMGPSIIAFKTVDAPAPSDVKLRIKNACEIVARKRASQA